MAPDPVSSVAAGGWASAWQAPAPGRHATGVLVGLEHSGFASLTTVVAATRFRVGPVWQLGFAQTSVTDLFDETLLAQFPELGTLRAAATAFSLDAALPFGQDAGVSVGGRYARDEFLGDAATVWSIRTSASGPALLGVRSAIALERVLAGGTLPKGTGRLRVGLAREFGHAPVAVTVGAGALLGNVWAVESGGTRLAGSVKLLLLRLVSLSASLGAEQDPFGTARWLGFAAFGLGLRVGAVGADVRRGDVGASDAVPTAVSLLYQRE